MKRVAAVVTCLLTGCASTTVEFPAGAPARPLCQSAGESVSAAVLWGTRWRTDQKEPPQREALADRGIREFFENSQCYGVVRVSRVHGLPAEADELAAQADASGKQRILVIAVRELGPIVRLFGTPALIEGGTEVVLDIAEYRPGTRQAQQAFTVHWRNGGPGVIKSTATLADDMKSALTAALQPAAAAP